MHYSTTQLRNHEYANHRIQRTNGAVCQDCLDVHGYDYICDMALERLITTQGVSTMTESSWH